MTREPITVTPDDTLAHALSLTREHRIRHLPVVSAGDRLVGVLSDRDIRLAMPSPLTVADWQRTDFLERTPIAAVMTRKVITVTGGDTIEDAAQTLCKHRIGCLPVVDASGALEGMLTITDILQAFVRLVGGSEQSSRIAIGLTGEPGVLAEAIRIIEVEVGVRIVSILLLPGDEERKTAVLYLATIDPREALEALRRFGFEVGWPSLEDLGSGSTS